MNTSYLMQYFFSDTIQGLEMLMEDFDLQPVERR